MPMLSIPIAFGSILDQIAKHPEILLAKNSQTKRKLFLYNKIIYFSFSLENYNDGLERRK
jgi:hypothetical protein